MMKTLIEAVREAEEKQKAIGHFNISNIEGLWAVFGAVKEVSGEVGEKIPVVIGISEGEREFVGIRQARVLVDSIRGEYDWPIYLNADHTYSFDEIKKVVEAGYDSVIFDGAGLSFDDNVSQTKRSVEYAKTANPDILVEGELGYIGKSSSVLDEIPEGAEVTSEFLTDPDTAKDFVEKTGIDMLAPAVGNLHGMLKNAANPDIDVERITAIRKTAGVPLVLHGGSGITDENFRKAIEAGISLIHVSTEIRVAYKEAVTKSWQDNPDDIAPYRLMRPVVDAMKEVVSQKLRLFNRV